MSAALPLLSTFASIGSTIFQSQQRADAVEQTYAAQQAAYNYNAQVAQNNAVQAENAAQFRADRVRTRNRQILATQRSAAGTSGFGIGDYSTILQNQAGELELDALAEIYTGKVEAGAARSQSGLQSFYGRQVASAGQSQANTILTEGYIKAGQQLLGKTGVNQYRF